MNTNAMNMIVNLLCNKDHIVFIIDSRLVTEIYSSVCNLLSMYPSAYILFTKQKDVRELFPLCIQHQILDFESIKNHSDEFTDNHISIVLAGIKIGFYDDGQISKTTMEILQMLEEFHSNVFCLHDPDILFALKEGRHPSVKQKYSNAAVTEELLAKFQAIQMHHMAGRINEALLFIEWACRQRNKRLKFFEQPLSKSKSLTNNTSNNKDNSQQILDENSCNKEFDHQLSEDETDQLCIKLSNLTSIESQVVYDFHFADLLWNSQEVSIG